MPLKTPCGPTMGNQCHKKTLKECMKRSKAVVLFGDTLGSLFCFTFFNKSEGLFLLASKLRKQRGTNESVGREFMERSSLADQTTSKEVVDEENGRFRE